MTNILDIEEQLATGQRAVSRGVFAACCSWAPGLPRRLKEMHGHWLSRKKGAIVLRGVQYTDSCLSFILALSSTREIDPIRESLMQCFCVPPQSQVCLFTTEATRSSFVL